MKSKTSVNTLLNNIRQIKNVTDEQIKREIESLYAIAARNKTGNKIIADVPLYMLAIDNRYQRTENFSVTKGNLIAGNFIEEAFDTIKLNKRNGRFYCPAGQHRIYAFIKMGRESIPAELFSVPLEKEIEIYLSQDDNRSKLTPYDRFKAGLAAGRTEDTTLYRICDRYNIMIGPASEAKNYRLGSITTAKNILMVHGEDALEWILGVVCDSGWDGQPKAFDSRIIRALRNAYAKIEQSAASAAIGASERENTQTLVQYLKHLTPVGLFIKSQEAYPGRDIETAMGWFLADIISGKRQGKVEKFPKAN